MSSEEGISSLPSGESLLEVIQGIANSSQNHIRRSKTSRIIRKYRYSGVLQGWGPGAKTSPGPCRSEDIVGELPLSMDFTTLCHDLMN